LGDPIFHRAREFEERPRAEKIFREYVNAVNVALTAGDDKYSHIPGEEMTKVHKEIERGLGWLNDIIGKQNERPKWETPIVTANQIIKERDVRLLRFLFLFLFFFFF